MATLWDLLKNQGQTQPSQPAPTSTPLNSFVNNYSPGTGTMYGTGSGIGNYPAPAASSGSTLAPGMKWQQVPGSSVQVQVPAGPAGAGTTGAGTTGMSYTAGQTPGPWSTGYVPANPQMAAQAGASRGTGGDEFADYNALMASIASGMGGGSEGSGSSALDSLRLGGTTSIMDSLMKQLGAAPNMPVMDIQKMAQNAISTKYNPAYQAIADRLASMGIEFQQGQSREQGYGQRADTALQGIYDALSKAMQEGNQRTLGYYDQAGQTSESSYDRAMAALQGLNQQVQGQLGKSAAGIGAASPTDPTGPLGRILANYASQQSANIGNKANTLSNLATTRANAGQFGESQLARAQNTGAQTRGDVAQQVQQALSQLNLGKVRGEGELGREKMALQKQQPLDLERIIGELTNQQYTMQEEARKNRLAEMVGLGNLDLGQQRNQISSQGNQVSLAKAQSQAKSSKTSDTFARQKFLAENVPAPPNTPQGQKQAATKASTSLTQARQENIVNPQIKPTIAAQGPVAMKQFLDTPQNGLWGDKAGPKFREAVQTLIDMAEQRGAGGINNPQQAALSLIQNDSLFGKSGKYKSLNKGGLESAIIAYFTGTLPR